MNLAENVVCRLGTKCLKILERITQGKGEEGDIELLEELGNTIKIQLCAVWANPAQTGSEYHKIFRHEYRSI